jgi:dTDP-glucose 4,6-dehydratase
MSTEFYIPNNILVTGGCGFIGSNFINYYKKKYNNIKIYNLDKIDYCSNKLDIDHDELFIGNLNNKEFITHILNLYNIDTIIHFAAQTHVDNSFGNSISFTKDNILGTHNLLECCREYNKIKRFIHMSTDEVYGEVDINNEGCIEKSILNPTNPYAATKAGTELIIKSYYYSFQFPIIIMRCNNVYGPRQYPEKLIPKFINSLLNNKKCTIHGEGNSRRNFIYIDDVSSAIDIIIKLGIINNIYNIGTKNEYSVLEIANKLINILKPNEDINNWIEYIDDRLFNDFRYAINNEKIINLGWKEENNFDELLLKTIEYYKFKQV